MKARLELDGVMAHYGKSQVLFGMTMALSAGEVVSLLGRNGMGKTTTVKAIIGMVRPRGGRVLFNGRDMSGGAMFRIARAGIGLVPEGRRIFPNLTVRENIVATARVPAGGARQWTLEKVLGLFPRLRERLDNLGYQLSGGEQQMLAIGRALATNPQLLLLDEATEGLAPLIREEIWAALRLLKANGQTILVIDKDVHKLTDVADRHYVIERGRVVWEGDRAALREQPEVIERYIGL